MLFLNPAEAEMMIGEKNLSGTEAALRQKKIDPDAVDALWDFFSEWTNSSGNCDAAVISLDPARMFRAFASRFRLMEAAGGLVENTSGDLLMIFRRGWWDLPKGKPDTGESAEDTAIREVMEECGIDRPVITGDLPWTMHLYREKHSDWVMKHSKWYRMRAVTGKKPVPQAQEDITRAEWFSPEQIEPLLDKVFRSVSDLLRLYMHLYR